jgi:hypothetical protein
MVLVYIRVNYIIFGKLSNIWQRYIVIKYDIILLSNPVSPGCDLQFYIFSVVHLAVVNPKQIQFTSTELHATLRGYLDWLALAYPFSLWKLGQAKAPAPSRRNLSEPVQKFRKYCKPASSCSRHTALTPRTGVGRSSRGFLRSC